MLYLLTAPIARCCLGLLALALAAVVTYMAIRHNEDDPVWPVDYPPKRWPQSPRIAVQCASWAANGPDHLGFCAGLAGGAEELRRVERRVEEGGSLGRVVAPLPAAAPAATC